MRALALTVVLCSSPLAAHAAPSGWSALQRSALEGSKTNDQQIQVSYGHHRLRVDNPGQRLIIDFQTGALTYVDIANKQFSVVTLEEMVALRASQMKAVRQNLEKLPPAMRTQMEAQLADAEAAAKRRIDAKADGTKGTFGGLSCEMYAWKGADSSGKACITRKVPFNTEPFRKDSQKLSRKMARLGAGSAASSMTILQLGEHGFPVMIDQRLRLGANDVSVMSTFTNVRASTKPKSFYEAPKGYRKRNFEEMMREQMDAAPKMPALPKR